MVVVKIIRLQMNLMELKMVYSMIYTPIIFKKGYGKEFWLILDFNIVLEWHQPVLMELCLFMEDLIILFMLMPVLI